MKSISTSQAMRYSRQILLAGFDLDKQEILINSRVLIIGVGGLGCAASQYLAASGVGQMTLVDDDVVELTNLQRQVLHDEASIGEKKVVSASRSLQRINSNVSVSLIEERQSQSELLALVKRHDMVLDCTDNLQTRNTLNRVCYQALTPLISGAAIRMEGQVFCVIPQQKSACYHCISRYFGEQSLSCVEAGVMSPVVGVIGSMQALEAIKVLCGYGEAPVNKLQIFDGMTSQWQSFQVNSDASCEVCGAAQKHSDE
ncbi:molybdopterin-synthase adenylyltransferase MoeB [Aliiglaciecola sp.]|nr:molybdopterin-synthase adenylyltransferase MoeB [Aliiglaciecola sp.]